MRSPTSRRRWAAALVSLAIGLSLAGAATGPDPGAKTASPSPDADAAAIEAVLLGRVRMQEWRPAEGTTLKVAFAAYAALPGDQAERLSKLLESRRQRVQDAIITAVRLCEQHDFQEPDLDRLRRRIWLRLDQTNPELGVEQVLIGEFEFYTD
ncbi:hypothetical protein [Botrimarina sp.]|uniref:hypothetical protein n=1 Tax=Botrimarina sp. TaxID=2795802 RepID=UPI0032EC9FDF